MSPVNSMFVCIKKKKLSANLFLKWPISIIGKMLNIGTDNRSTPRSNAREVTLRSVLGMLFMYLCPHLVRRQMLKTPQASHALQSMYVCSKSVSFINRDAEHAGF